MAGTGVMLKVNYTRFFFNLLAVNLNRNVTSYRDYKSFAVTTQYKALMSMVGNA